MTNKEAGVLHIDEAVITGDCLSQRFGGETEVHLLKTAVVTPSGWDFIRQHRLQVVRAEGKAMLRTAASPSGGTGGGQLVRETRPSSDNTCLLQQGRYDYPDRAFGCKTEEFGSGFVEPSSCHDCALNGQQQAPAAKGGACRGCNRHRTLQASGQSDIEDLVQRLTEEIISRLS